MTVHGKASGRDIALALGVTPQRVSQLRRDGMPADSIDAALSWYRRRVDPVRSAAQRRAGSARAAAPGPRPRAAGGDDLPLALALVARLWPAAADEVARGPAGQAVALLRVALAQVPDELRPRVALPIELWRELVADVRDVVGAFEPPAESAESMPDEDRVATMAAFWYAAAAGEVLASNPERRLAEGRA
ncbi:MAG: hypothetical protein U1E86_07710 [Burkholderiaceae bacterium]